MVRSWAREFFIRLNELFVATIRSYHNLSADIMLTLQRELGRNVVVHINRGVGARTRVFVFGAKGRGLDCAGSHRELGTFTNLCGLLVCARSRYL